MGVGSEWGGGPVDRHPTLRQVEARREELRRQHRRDRVVVPVLAFLPVVIVLTMVFGVLVLALAQGSYLLAVGFLLGGYSLTRATFYASDCYAQLPRPPVLVLAQFTPAENSYLRGVQTVREPVRAWCVCPGCGYVDAHPFLADTDNVPPWAEVIRKCRTCAREWGQV